MAVRPPDESDLAAVGERYGLGLNDADVASFAPFATGLLGSWTAVEELYARTAPAPRTDRPWSRPDDADNPLGAWYVTTEIQESSDGPLAGRTVAIKDNIDGRRRADDERLGHGGGLRPDARRHGGHPAARRRRHDHGQGGVRGPVLLRRQPHVA